jgi:hypothetical protein
LAGDFPETALRVLLGVLATTFAMLDIKARTTA